MAEVDWTAIIMAVISLVGVVFSGLCTVLSLHLRMKHSKLEEVVEKQGKEILALQAQTTKCEEERRVDHVRHEAELRERDDLLEAEWPSDDFTSSDLAAKIHRVAVASGLKIKVAQVGMLVRRLQKKKTDLDRGDEMPVPNQEFFP